MQIRNIDSWVSLEIQYWNDFQFTGNDKNNRLFYEPVVIRWRNWGSYLNNTETWRNVWDFISRLCFNQNSNINWDIKTLSWVHSIQWDKNDWQKTTLIKTGVDTSWKLLFWLESFEDNNPNKKKKVEFVISCTEKQCAWLLVVSENEFQRFINLALIIQAFAISRI